MKTFGDSWGNYLLKDIAETSAPQSVDYLPQTTGWLLLACLVFVGAVKILVRRWRIYKQNAYRREALAWLNNLPSYLDITTTPEYRQLPTLLRATALHAFKKEELTVLANEQWENWLDQQCNRTSFSDTYKTYLYQLAYSPQPKFSVKQMEEFVRQVEIWIDEHQIKDEVA